MTGKCLRVNKVLRTKSSIRTRIMSTFSLLLLVTFIIMGLAFNYAVNLYIRQHAAEVLNNAVASSDIRNIPDDIQSMIPHVNYGDEPRNFILRTNLNVFVINDSYSILNVPSQSLDEATLLAKYLQSTSFPLDMLNLHFARTGERVFYLSAMGMPDDLHVVYYVDVTGLSAFTGMINILLLSLTGFIWLLASAASTFLAGTIARPIRVLSKYSQQIGEGYFAPNNMTFNNIEFEALNQSLNHTAQQLAQYDNEQKIFFQNVSHELRTPLMSIKCYAEGIQYGVMEPESASKTILEETDRLALMVDDILYISRIDNLTAAQITESIDVGKLTAECVSRQQAVAESRQLKLILITDTEGKIIKCAPKHISRALNNLISNALRYAESIVTVSCTVKENEAVIKVIDDGPGIAENDMPHLFERFYKGKEGLNGIGLSMVKSISEQHQGNVSVRNLDKGAEFTMRLPR